MGNLETASGNLQESRSYFDRAVQIWADGGDATASTLAFTYLSAGRMHMLQGNLTEAMNLTQMAESLFIRTIGADKGFMAKYTSSTSLHIHLMELMSKTVSNTHMGTSSSCKGT
jgi:hypothetical protein